MFLYEHIILHNYEEVLEYNKCIARTYMIEHVYPFHNYVALMMTLLGILSGMYHDYINIRNIVFWLKYFKLENIIWLHFHGSTTTIKLHGKSNVEGLN